MKPGIVLVGNMTPSVVAALEQSYTVHRVASGAEPAPLAPEVRAGIRGIATGGSKGAGTALIGSLPALEIIAVNGVGTDAVDLDACVGRGIRVTTTPEILTDDVADIAIGLMLATARTLALGDRFVRGGGWLSGQLPLATKVTGKRLGVLGLGRIGRAIARRAEGFDMKIAYVGRRRQEDVPYRFEPSLPALARSSDILVLAAAGGPQSQGLVDREVLEALGPEGILVNIARGSIVDEPALVEALTSGRLGGAGLDVFAREPEIPEALLGLDNVVLSPHQASATRETRAAMGRLVLDNLAAHFAGRPLLTPVARADSSPAGLR